MSVGFSPGLGPFFNDDNRNSQNELGATWSGVDPRDLRPGSDWSRRDPMRRNGPRGSRRGGGGGGGDGRVYLKNVILAPGLYKLTVYEYVGGREQFMPQMIIIMNKKALDLCHCYD